MSNAVSLPSADQSWWVRTRATLKAAWPNFPWNEATFAVYRAALVRHEDQLIAEAVQELIIDNEFAPPVAVIVRKIAAMRHARSQDELHEQRQLDVEKAMREAAKDSEFVGLLHELVKLRLDRKISQGELTALTIGPPSAPRRFLGYKASPQHHEDVRACLARFA